MMCYIINDYDVTVRGSIVRVLRIDHYTAEVVLVWAPHGKHTGSVWNIDKADIQSISYLDIFYDL